MAYTCTHMIYSSDS